jgi:hypothetical protein
MRKPQRFPTRRGNMALALTGEWAGYLEYLDYSEPATSMEWLEARMIGSGDFAFRHSYRFTQSKPPAVTSAR